MNQLKPSTILAAAAWASLLALTWLLVTGILEMTAMRAVFFVFFGFIAAGASSVASPGKRDVPDSPLRLDAHNRVALPEGVVRELGLRPGDAVAFVRTGRGRWEVRTASAVVEEVSVLDE